MGPLPLYQAATMGLFAAWLAKPPPDNFAALASGTEAIGRHGSSRWHIIFLRL